MSKNKNENGWLNTLGEIAEFAGEVATFYFDNLEKENQRKLDQDRALHDAFEREIKASYAAGYKDGYVKGASSSGFSLTGLVLDFFLTFLLIAFIYWLVKKCQKKHFETASSDQQAAISQKVYSELQSIKKEIKTIKGQNRIKRTPRGESSSLKKRQTSSSKISAKRSSSNMFISAGGLQFETLKVD